MDGSTVTLVVWALSAAVSAAVIRRRRYEGGLAIGLFICAALGGPVVLGFFVWASL